MTRTGRSDQGQRRRLPSVDALLRSEPGRRGISDFGRALVKRLVQRALEDARADVARGIAPPSDDVLMARALGAAARAFYGLSDVVNATGVVLHTGLGRAPLPEAAAQIAARAGKGYADLEVDRTTGKRGRRTSRAETLLTALTGAEEAFVVNNNAAALMLTLGALARRREVLVSRGELIEIGGEFRLPEIMAAAGAKLVEVGTTNRTRLTDYRAAVSSRTAAILKVHPSNYRVVGFTHSPPTPSLVGLARGAGIPFVYDLGSGLLERLPGIPTDEPSAAETLRDGADLVCFSGDKLLGGPQAGIVVGRRDLVDRLRRDPVARAVRVDKMQVAALEAVLRTYATGRWKELPVWQMLLASERSIRRRAGALAERFEGAEVRRSESAQGGGALPGHGIPTWVVALAVGRPEVFAARLRLGNPAVFCRVDEDRVVFDLRTVPPEDDDRLTRAIVYALEQE